MNSLPVLQAVEMAPSEDSTGKRFRTENNH
jgi:hypothetical protein